MNDMPHMGDTVRLKKGVGRSRQTAVVVGYDASIKGSVHLDAKLDGFGWWNMADLELVKVKGRVPV